MNITARLIGYLLVTLVVSNTTVLPLRPVPGTTPEPPPLWLYLRDGEHLAPSEKPIVLMAVGDLMLGKIVGFVFLQVNGFGKYCHG